MRTLLVLVSRIDDTLKAAMNEKKKSYGCLCGRWYSKKCKLRNHIDHCQQKFPQYSGGAARNTIYSSVKHIKYEVRGKSFKCKTVLNIPLHPASLQQIKSSCDCTLGWIRLNQEAKHYLKKIASQDALAQKVYEKEIKRNRNIVQKAKTAGSILSYSNFVDTVDAPTMDQNIFTQEDSSGEIGAKYPPSATKIESVMMPTLAKEMRKKQLRPPPSPRSKKASFVPINVQVTQLGTNSDLEPKHVLDSQSLPASSNDEQGVIQSEVGAIRPIIEKQRNQKCHPEHHTEFNSNSVQLPRECQKEVVECKEIAKQPAAIEVVDLTGDFDCKAKFELPRPVNLIKCSTCNIAFHSSDELQEHLSAHAGCKCYVCGQEIKNDATLKGCIKHVHTNSGRPPNKEDIELIEFSENGLAYCCQHHLLLNTVLVLHQERTSFMQPDGTTCLKRKSLNNDNESPRHTSTKLLHKCCLCNVTFAKQVYLKAHVFKMHVKKTSPSYPSWRYGC